jgi:ABC-type transport system involved in multi-copper enzyme maturation permease subunit
MNAFLATTWNGFREARRNRVTVVVGAFALVTLLLATLVTQVTVVTFRRVMVDTGLGLMSLILVFLSIFLSSGLLAREIERRTIFLVVTKPISRSMFLWARFAGNLLTLLVLQAVMTAIFVAELSLYRFPVGPAVWAALGMLVVELFVVTTIGFFCSSFLGQTVSAVVTVGLYFAGHLSGDLYRFGQKAGGLASTFGRATYFALPNLDRLNYRSLATYDVVPTLDMALKSAASGLAYGIGLLVVASIIFERRDFK